MRTLYSVCTPTMLRKLRALAVSEQLADDSELMILDDAAICRLVLANYAVVYVMDEQVGLVRKDKLHELDDLLIKI